MKLRAIFFSILFTFRGRTGKPEPNGIPIRNCFMCKLNRINKIVQYEEI
jgi:hypothetical protein